MKKLTDGFLGVDSEYEFIDILEAADAYSLNDKCILHGYDEIGGHDDEDEKDVILEFHWIDENGEKSTESFTLGNIRNARIKQSEIYLKNDMNEDVIIKLFTITPFMPSLHLWKSIRRND